MEKVAIGDKIEFKATEWNEIAAATNHYLRNRPRGGGDAIERSRNYLVNGTDIILGSAAADHFQFEAVALGDPVPDTGNPEWHQKLSVEVTAPTGDPCEAIGIAQEDIKAGEMGRILVSGVSPCKLTMTDDDDDIAVGQSGSGILISRGSTGSEKVGGQGARIIYGDATWGLVAVGLFNSCHATCYLGTLAGAIASDDDPLEAEVDGLVALNGKATTDSTITAINEFKWDADEDAKVYFCWDDAGERWVLLQVECP